MNPAGIGILKFFTSEGEPSMKLKTISEQTMVITGATSGIGLATARMAAEQGARLVLVARNEDALRELTGEINSKGGRAIYSVADVADELALRSAANKAKAEFGGFDTWVNNAGGSIYGRIMDVPTEDMRRMFETNFWGVVNGSRVAVEHLRERGGALINVGSEVSDSPVPLQGAYSASKHAVKGFTDSLRIELEADGLPVSVTLVKPTAINTPFPEHAKNYLPYEQDLPQPLYAPELVAEAILHCAQTPVRDFFVGDAAAVRSAMATYTPRLADKFMEATIDSMQNSGEPARRLRSDGLYETDSDLRERGKPERFTMEDAVYQHAKMRPFLTSALAVGTGLGIAALISWSRSKSGGDHGDGSERRIGGSGEGSFPPLDAGGFDASEIHEKMEVVGADGAHLGTIDRVEDGQIKLTREDSSDGRHHLISPGLVSTVAGGQVRLSVTADRARQMWRAVEDAAASAPSMIEQQTGGEPILSHRQTDNLSKSQTSSS
jgi:short-subunit dehydrogenase